MQPPSAGAVRWCAGGHGNSLPAGVVLGAGFSTADHSDTDVYAPSARGGVLVQALRWNFSRSPVAGA